MRFEWDPDKADANRSKHRVSFKQARELFTSGVDYLIVHDETHSLVEERFVAIGPICIGVVLVAFTETDEDTVRIISARRATGGEQRLFYEHEGRRRGR